MGSKFIVPLRLLELNTTPALPLTSWHKLYYKDGYLKTLKSSEKDLVLDRPLDGFVAGPCVPIVATDTVLEAFQKLQCQVSAIPQLCGNPISDIFPGDTLTVCRWNGSSYDVYSIDAASLFEGNIYNSDGTLNGNRIVNMDGNGLLFLDETGTVPLLRIIDSGLGSSYVEIGDNTTTGYETFQVNGILVNAGGLAITPSNGYIAKIASGGFLLDLNVATLLNNRSQEFQDASGVIALLSDIPTVPSTLSYGLFNQINNSTPVQGSTNNGGSLLITGVGNSVGSLSVPANTFQEGDAFKLEGAGHLSVTGPPPDLTLKVLFNGIAELVITMSSLPNVSDLHWRMEINFTIRSTGSGGTGNGQVMTALKFFHEEDANDKVNGHSLTQLSNLDTTVANTLDITATWGTGDDTDIIYSEIMTLNKTY